MARPSGYSIDVINNSMMEADQRIVTTLAIASSIANTIGFLANLFLYGINFPTIFCAICAVFCWVTLIVGVRSKNYMVWGTIMMVALCVLEFPLLLLTYGPIMLPYVILGYMGVLMLSHGKNRAVLCILLTVYNVGMLVIASLHPYIFGPQDPIGLLGSAIITFVIATISLSVCIIIWQSVYISQTSDVDPITKALTKKGFTRAMQRIMKTAAPGQYAMLYFDVINFQSCNTVYGFDGGNQVLAQLADRFRLSSKLKPLLVSRHDAGHFYVLADSKNISPDVITDICRFNYLGTDINQSLQLNCGIYIIDDPAMNIQGMRERAKAATNYSAQIRNVHWAVYDDEMEKCYELEIETLAMVEEAITNKKFVPYYQPVVDCKTGKIASVEALARWIRDDETVIPPGRFIQVLEQMGLISELDMIITEKVKEFLEKRHDQGKSIIPVSINLSRVDLYNDKLMNQIHEMLCESELPECGYRFEVTESIYEAIPANISERLSQFRKLGALILIDDFGSGYSSLGMITDCEFDIIKLDMSFAHRIDDSDKIRGVVSSLIELTHNLGAKVIAEGVETESQYQFLKEKNCDYIQGYYFYQPMRAEELEKLIDEG